MAEPLLTRACRREAVERTPVWFMRQAGRSLPEYRELRKCHDLFSVCRQPELCAEVTLQPVRAHGVDAAVSADTAHSLHYIVTATGNAPSTDFARSMVMFRPGFKPAAQRLAKDMGVKAVIPLDGITKGDLQGAQLALIIGG